jgi:FAD/FMN-containing dehydrogenase
MAKTFLEEASPEQGIVVNDIHSGLNPTRVQAVSRPQSREDISKTIIAARQGGHGISISGGRHAMGGQQFGTDAHLIDTTLFNRMLSLDDRSGLVTVEGGITWGRLIAELQSVQAKSTRQWVIKQKPSGADDLSIAGSMAANAHGRGLTFAPLVGDVESFSLIDARGALHEVTRNENADLFRLAIGGYGMFGVVSQVTLRLQKRAKLRRHVEIIRIADLMDSFDRCISAGFTYGDFQFDIDNQSKEFLTRGIFAAYEPIDMDYPLPEKQFTLSLEEWRQLLYLAHTDKASAFDMYCAHYLKSNGQIYTSDVHQLSKYIDHYHLGLDEKLGAQVRATEIITEVYVPRDRLVDFMETAAEYFQRQRTSIIYGTIRLIEKDNETFLPWAKEKYACIIFNLHTDHSPEGLSRSRSAFRRLIDLVIERQGSYYLTYHRFAERAQVEACYPQFQKWLALKLKHDGDEIFQSDWYRHYRDLFSR